MNIQGGSGGLLPRENLKFRSSERAGKAPKTRIFLILMQPFYGHAPAFWYKKSCCKGCTRLMIGSVRKRSCRVLPYTADGRFLFLFQRISSLDVHEGTKAF